LNPATAADFPHNPRIRRFACDLGARTAAGDGDVQVFITSAPAVHRNVNKTVRRALARGLPFVQANDAA
jgi:hypothetical protein